MTKLKSRHEKFCRKYVQFGCAAVAARAAGYAPGSSNNTGYRLIRHPRISRRIAEIEAEVGETHTTNRDVLLGKLETVFRRAIVDHHFNTAARAVDLQARLRGFIGAGAALANDETGREADGWNGGARGNGGLGRPVYGNIGRPHRREHGFDDF
jgi:hypothetical protein